MTIKQKFQGLQSEDSKFADIKFQNMNSRELKEIVDRHVQILGLWPKMTTHPPNPPS
jgi:hypothetical protein